MNDQIYKYEIEIENPDFVDPEKQGYGAFISGEVSYTLERVTVSDTPLGPQYGHKVVIHEIGDATMFVSDQDGGELYETETDLLEYATERQIIEQIEKDLNREVKK